jgi:hypothetical protein
MVVVGKKAEQKEPPPEADSPPAKGTGNQEPGETPEVGEGKEAEQP